LHSIKHICDTFLHLSNLCDTRCLLLTYATCFTYCTIHPTYKTRAACFLHVRLVLHTSNMCDTCCMLPTCATRVACFQHGQHVLHASNIPVYDTCCLHPTCSTRVARMLSVAGLGKSGCFVGSSAVFWVQQIFLFRILHIKRGPAFSCRFRYSGAGLLRAQPRFNVANIFFKRIILKLHV
jgi:hypothetical protein